MEDGLTAQERIIVVSEMNEELVTVTHFRCILASWKMI